MGFPRADPMKNLLLSSLLLAFTYSAFSDEAEEVVLEGVVMERPDGSFLQFLLWLQSRIDESAPKGDAAYRKRSHSVMVRRASDLL